LKSVFGKIGIHDPIIEKSKVDHNDRLSSQYRVMPYVLDNSEWSLQHDNPKKWIFVSWGLILGEKITLV
jgi:hypothetical protein